MLRLGRLGCFKCLQLESWGVLRSGSAAALCTQAEETAKSTKKTEAASKNCASAEALGDAAEEAPEEATTEPLEAEAAPAQVAAETPAEVSAPVESPKELMDPAPVIVEAVEADLQAEATVEPSEEIAVAAPPEPEEPFDNSTYKNYQHHCYTPYTFADLDVEMAKFRLPQPSSGRPSPRH
ncbi:uncharacterized protein ndufv3 isoform X3 [Hippoglossus hippoglossus]|uniref:uncharacterized protein ndufv3 isoform X3 n=1 Tax=Hippoglossus hippoglossus TaxID=8267 RepID=UPI00148D12E0|nr:uncharacterized protein ndufv3 isoform X3 [Hippoglossus hippoglossus]